MFPTGSCQFTLFYSGADVFVLNTGLGSEEDQNKVKELLYVGVATSSDDKTPAVSWLQDDRYKHGAIKLQHFKVLWFHIH